MWILKTTGGLAFLVLTCALLGISGVAVSRWIRDDRAIRKAEIEQNLSRSQRLFPAAKSEPVVVPTDLPDWSILMESDRRELMSLLGRIPEIERNIEEVAVAFPERILLARFRTRRNSVYCVKDEHGNWRVAKVERYIK